jgi:drug/metabolite transporter (DMT)-like permease
MTSRTSRAIAVMLLAMFLFACMDAVNKNLSQTYAIAQILWVRFVFFLAFAVLVARQRMRLGVAIRSRAFWLQSARSVLLIGEIGTFILALHYRRCWSPGCPCRSWASGSTGGAGQRSVPALPAC